MDETSPEQSLNGESKSKDSSEMSDDIQDMPEDLSSNNSSCRHVKILIMFIGYFKKFGFGFGTTRSYLYVIF